jgi:succinate dehydrogenase hydrophobic anchor subunit
VSNRVIPLTVLLIGVTQIQILIFYTISARPTVCLGQPILFQTINGLLILLIWSIIPFLLMLIFGLLTIRHVRQSTHLAHHRYKRTRFIDRQLTQIMLIQSILFMLTSAAGALGGMLNVLDDNSRKNPLELAKQSFLGIILLFAALLGPCVSFYLCTLSSQLFRRELRDLLHRRRQNAVHEIATIAPLPPRTH